MVPRPSLRGVYPVQPNSAAPPGVMKPATAIIPPNTKSQWLNAFSPLPVITDA